MNQNKQELHPQQICALILSAGYSSRMGSFKPLLSIGDITAIEQIIESLKAVGLQKIFTVTGYQRELLAPVIQREKIREIYNEDFEQGMFTSIKAGIRQAFLESNTEIKGFFLMLVDCPLISPAILELMIKTHREHPDSFIVPCFRGKKGHPLFIPSIYAKEILAYKGEGGLKAITRRYEDRFIRLDVEDEAVVLDMDTPEGYQEILDYYEKQSQGINSNLNTEKWKELLSGRRLFLVRHGQTEQHKDKIFLGQTDIPLSHLGREQALKAGLKLKQCKVITDRIYTSDLSRAAETAEIIAEVLEDPENFKTNDTGQADRIDHGKIYFVKDKGFREMALGEWDGKLISEVKEKYPEEYKKRGENLLTYKYGNESENFYDLQYRVMKNFEAILRLEQHEAKLLKERTGREFLKDIVIVAHTGVLKVILSNIYGTDLQDELKRKIPNGGISVVEQEGKKQ